MKTKLFDKSGNEKGTVDLPKVFTTTIREDILLKVYEAQKGSFMQEYGSKEGAGAQYSASGIIKKQRHDWKASYGKGISRVPRKIMSRHGASFNWIGATIPGARGGRRAHPPKSEKVLDRKINKKELKMAFRSALAGTVNPNSIEKKYGKKTGSGFVFKEEILQTKTKDFITALKKAFQESQDQILKRKSIRSGIGKMRGRKYKSNAGLLFIVGKSEKMKRAGISVVNSDKLSIRDLCPNGQSGRLTAYTENAIKELGEKFS